MKFTSLSIIALLLFSLGLRASHCRFLNITPPSTHEQPFSHDKDTDSSVIPVRVGCLLMYWQKKVLPLPSVPPTEKCTEEAARTR